MHTNRRRFLQQTMAGLAVAGLSGLTLKAAAQNSTSMNKPLLHYVLFWLDSGLSSEEVENFKGFFEELRKIPTVKKLQVGVPAATEVRGVVDNSFSYSMLATFDTLEDHNIYQDHEHHTKAIEKYSKYWTKVVVHDMTEI